MRRTCFTLLLRTAFLIAATTLVFSSRTREEWSTEDCSRHPMSSSNPLPPSTLIFAEARRVRLRVKGGYAGLQRLLAGFNTKFGCNDPRGIATHYKWDNKTNEWDFPKNNKGVHTALPCGYQPMRTVESIVNRFKGKHILFVGDSTVRNVMQTLFAELCNPVYMTQCSQRVVWPFQDTDRWHGMNCRNDSSLNECKDIKFKITQLPGLTEKDYYLSRKQRTELFWKQKKIPPMLTAEFRGVKASVIEAGCYHPGNALHRVLLYLTKPETRSNVPHVDILVSGGGMHCSLVDYIRNSWHSVSSKAMNLVQKYRAPTVFLELPHCLYFVANVSFRSIARNYATCDIHSNRKKRVEKKFIGQHVPYSPTRFISKGTHLVKNIDAPLSPEEQKHHCLFADDMHPSLVCYRAMLQVHLNAMVASLRNWKKPNRTTLALLEAEILAHEQEMKEREENNSTASTESGADSSSSDDSHNANPTTSGGTGHAGDDSSSSSSSDSSHPGGGANEAANRQQGQTIVLVGENEQKGQLSGSEDEVALAGVARPEPAQKHKADAAAPSAKKRGNEKSSSKAPPPPTGAKKKKNALAAALDKNIKKRGSITDSKATTHLQNRNPRGREDLDVGDGDGTLHEENLRLGQYRDTNDQLVSLSMMLMPAIVAVLGTLLAVFLCFGSPTKWQGGNVVIANSSCGASSKKRAGSKKKRKGDGEEWNEVKL